METADGGRQRKVIGEIPVNKLLNATARNSPRVSVVIRYKG
jgi:hypothetical protein